MSLYPSLNLSPGAPRAPQTRPKKAEKFGFSKFLVDFFAFRNALQKRRRKNIEKNAKIKDFGLPKPSQNRVKIDVPKNMRFFIDFCSNFDGCCKSQHQKNVRPRSVLLTFHTMRCFAFGMHFRSKKPTKNFKKTTSEPVKHGCRKRVAF